MSRNLYGLMMKFPEPGLVKTRLASGIGAEAAADVYRRIAETVRRNTAGSPAYERFVMFAPADRREDFEAWLQGEELLPQRGDGLGEIMLNCIGDLFRMGAEKVVITGADIPGLGRSIIEDAFRSLEAADLVLGPAEDGGYYLVGMKRLLPQLFEGIAFGGPEVFRQTAGCADRAGLRWSTVQKLADLDTSTDLERLERTGLLRNFR